MIIYMSSIFLSQNDSNDISGKITYTDILESIPENKLEERLDGWEKLYETEWRWRFLEIPNQGTTRNVIEISYLRKKSNKRIYFNKYGEWVKRDVDPIFDQYIKKVYYVYTN